MMKEPKTELREKSVKKLAELYDKRNFLLAQVNNINLEIDGLISIINYIDNKIELNEISENINDIDTRKHK